MTQDKEWLDLQERKHTLQNLWVPHVFHSTKKVRATEARPRAAMPCGIRRCAPAGTDRYEAAGPRVCLRLVRSIICTGADSGPPPPKSAAGAAASLPGLGLTPAGSHQQRGWAHPCQIGSRTALTPSTSDGDWAHSSLYRRRDSVLQIRAARESAAECPPSRGIYHGRSATRRIKQTNKQHLPDGRNAPSRDSHCVAALCAQTRVRALTSVPGARCRRG
jgi:hypothetical protein